MNTRKRVCGCPDPSPYSAAFSPTLIAGWRAVGADDAVIGVYVVFEADGH